MDCTKHLKFLILCIILVKKSFYFKALSSKS